MSHSLTFALLAAGAGASALVARGRAFGPTFAILFAACASHLVLDLLGGTDSRPPYGLPLLWPVSDAVLQSPVSLLLGVRHDVWGTPLDWLRSLFHPFNLAAIAWEIALTGPFVLLGLRRRRRSAGS